MYMRYFALPSNTSTIGIHNIDISSCNNMNDKKSYVMLFISRFFKEKQK